MGMLCCEEYGKLFNSNLHKYETRFLKWFVHIGIFM
jgi:hypothetical protein